MEKLEILRNILKSYGKVAVAYSGGCDSNFLFNVAVNTLGKENVLAVLCNGAMMAKDDLNHALNMLEGYNHEVVDVDVFEVEAFKYNHKDRCYHCKKSVMGNVIEQAKKHGFKYVVDGKNLDDDGGYRPGQLACMELGILSPLHESKLTKHEIRMYSKQLNIETHDKPSNACLATRFDYNTELTAELLSKVDYAENIIRSYGIKNCRLRLQDQLARIEVEPNNFSLIVENKELINKLKEIGFKFITLDLEGLKSGSYDK